MALTYYDKEGNLIPMWDWVALIESEDPNVRIVAKTQVGDTEVSTVWLGINMNFGGSGPPIIFETMVFGGPLDEQMDRYSTETEALAGHTAMVMRVKAAES
jgi:hypothetical protein